MTPLSYYIACIHLTNPSGSIPPSARGEALTTNALRVEEAEKSTLVDPARRMAVFMMLEANGSSKFTDPQKAMRAELSAYSENLYCPQLNQFQLLFSLLVDSIEKLLSKGRLAGLHLGVASEDGVTTDIEQILLQPLMVCHIMMSEYVRHNSKDELAKARSHLDECALSFSTLSGNNQVRTEFRRVENIYSLLHKCLNDDVLLPLLFEPINHSINIDAAEMPETLGVKLFSVHREAITYAGYCFELILLPEGLDRNRLRKRKELVGKMHQLLNGYKLKQERYISSKRTLPNMPYLRQIGEISEFTEVIQNRRETRDMLSPISDEYLKLLYAFKKLFDPMRNEDEEVHKQLQVMFDALIRGTHDTYIRYHHNAVNKVNYWISFSKTIKSLDAQIANQLNSGFKTSSITPLALLRKKWYDLSQNIVDGAPPTLPYDQLLVLQEYRRDLNDFFRYVRNTAVLFQNSSNSTLEEKKIGVAYLIECIDTHVDSVSIIQRFPWARQFAKEIHKGFLGLKKALERHDGAALLYITTPIDKELETSSADRIFFKEVLVEVGILIAEALLSTEDEVIRQRPFLPQVVNSVISKWREELSELSIMLQSISDQEVNDEQLYKIVSRIVKVDRNRAREADRLEKNYGSYLLPSNRVPPQELGEFILLNISGLQGMIFEPLVPLKEWAYTFELIKTKQKLPKPKTALSSPPMEKEQEAEQVEVVAVAAPLPALVESRSDLERIRVMLFCALSQNIETTRSQGGLKTVLRSELVKSTRLSLLRTLDIIESLEASGACACQALQGVYSAKLKLAIEQTCKIILAFLDIREDGTHVLFTQRDEYSKQQLRASHNLESLTKALRYTLTDEEKQLITKVTFDDGKSVITFCAKLLSNHFSILPGEGEEKQINPLTIGNVILDISHLMQLEPYPFLMIPPIRNENAKSSSARYVINSIAYNHYLSSQARINELSSLPIEQLDTVIRFDLLAEEVHILLESTLLICLAIRPLSGKDEKMHMLLDSHASNTQTRPLKYSHRLDLFARALSLTSEEVEICTRFTNLLAYVAYGTTLPNRLSHHLKNLSLLASHSKNEGFLSAEEHQAIKELGVDKNFDVVLNKEVKKVQTILQEGIDLATHLTTAYLQNDRSIR